MPKNRLIQKELVRIEAKSRDIEILRKQNEYVEQMLESKNVFNCTDKTPMNVIRVQKGLEIIY